MKIPVLLQYYPFRHPDTLTTNPFIHVIRCTTRLDTQTHSQPIRLSIVILSKY